MEVRGSMRKYEEVVEEGRGPAVLKSKSPKGPKVQGSQGPICLKVKFKYKLNSKEGPSCLELKSNKQNGIFKNKKVQDNWMN